MSSLNSHQKELIFDYCIGLVTAEQASEVQELIEKDQGASKFFSNLKSYFERLDALDVEECPHDLAEKTIASLTHRARSGYQNLERLLEKERTKIGRFVWPDLAQRLATAAIFMIVGGVLITAWNSTTSYMRQRSIQTQCQAQLGGIYQGITNYKNDNDGKLPSAASEIGLPWWMVGNQRQNYSNTRPIFHLVKQGYIRPDQCICPGHNHESRPELTQERISDLNDFPSREYITYSFELRCKEAGKMSKTPKVIMSDMNPLFEIIPGDFTNGTLIIILNDKLMKINSINHNRRGQNIMFCNGSIKFVRNRRIGVTQDDIFTLQNTTVYKGIETPSSETDRFLAP